MPGLFLRAVLLGRLLLGSPGQGITLRQQRLDALAHPAGNGACRSSASTGAVAGSGMAVSPAPAATAAGPARDPHDQLRQVSTAGHSNPT